MRYNCRVLVASVFLLSAICVAQTAPLHLEKEIPLPNVKGRIDHLSADVKGQRLFVSALGNGTLEVIDIRSGQRVREIGGLSEPQGVLYDGNSNKIFIASGGDGTVREYDGKSFTLLKTTVLGDDADNVRYDTQSKQVVVGYGSGGLASFDTNLQKNADIKLPSHPESFQLEQNGPRVFVNLPESHRVAVIDRSKKAVVNEWPDTGAAANFPMALDENDKRLFVGFRAPARLFVFNAETGSVVAKLPTVGDTDDLFYDAARHAIYVIGGEGFVDIFRQGDANHYEYTSRMKTSAGARAGLFVPSLSRLFVAAPRRGSQAARILVYKIGM